MKARQTAVTRSSNNAPTSPEPAAVGPGDHLPPATGARLGKTGRDLEDVGLREAGFDPVGDAGMLPDQRVGCHAQRLHLVLTRDLELDDVGLARDPRDA